MSERRVYSEEFKRDAIKLAEDRGNIRDTARSLGVAPRMLQRWRQQLKVTPDRPFPGHGNPQDIELARLKRQVARLQYSSGSRSCTTANEYIRMWAT